MKKFHDVENDKAKYTCSSCNDIQFSTRGQYRQHLTSKIHAENSSQENIKQEQNKSPSKSKAG